MWRLRRFYAQDLDGGGTGSRPGTVLQARRASGHESRLRTPHPPEPDRSVPPRPRPGPASFGRVTASDSRSAPRRDDYDKKVKQAAKEKARRRHTPAPTRPRKPDLQVYLPRHRGEQPPPAARSLGKPPPPRRGSCSPSPYRSHCVSVSTPRPPLQRQLSNIFTEGTWDPARNCCPPVWSAMLCFNISAIWKRESLAEI